MEKQKSFEMFLVLLLIIGIALISAVMFYDNDPNLDYVHNTTIESYQNNNDNKLEVTVINKTINLSCPSFTCPSFTCPNCYCETPIISVFEQVIKNNAEEHKYKENYDCTEHSKELERRLDEMGWRSNWIQRIVDCDNEELFDFESCNKYNGRHDFVIVYNVYIEATM